MINAEEIYSKSIKIQKQVLQKHSAIENYANFHKLPFSDLLAYKFNLKWELPFNIY